MISPSQPRYFQTLIPFSVVRIILVMPILTLIVKPPPPSPFSSWNLPSPPDEHGSGSAIKVKDCICDQPHSPTDPPPEIKGAGSRERLEKANLIWPGVWRAKVEAWEAKRGEQRPGRAGGVLHPPPTFSGGWGGGQGGRKNYQRDSGGTLRQKKTMRRNGRKSHQYAILLYCYIAILAEMLKNIKKWVLLLDIQ